MEKRQDKGKQVQENCGKVNVGEDTKEYDLFIDSSGALSGMISVCLQ